MIQTAESERKALDLLRYSHNSPFNHSGLIRDVAALSTEVGTDRKVTQRVHRTLETTDGNKVINWPVDRIRDVNEQFLPNIPESVAGIKIRDVLINKPDGTMFAWFSPQGGPYKYDEGRLRIGVVKNKLGNKILESYGIPLNFEPSQCVAMFIRLQEFSQELPQYPQSCEELRDKIVVFNSPNNDEYWLDFLKKQGVLPELTDVWNSIKSGEIGRFNRKALRESRKAIQNTLHLNNTNVVISAHQALILGAKIEQHMINRGWNMVSKVCGLLNSDILFGQTPLSLLIGYQDNRITIEFDDGKGPRKFPCPACDYINERPFGGYVEKCQNKSCPAPEKVRC